jgi:hypothetical protein
LVDVFVDPDDKRSRRIELADRGRDLLVAAVPVWRETHAEVDRALPGLDPERLRGDLLTLS